MSSQNRDKTAVDEGVDTGQQPSDARGISPLVYELFVLGELMIKPMHGYHLREMADRILGPLQPLSWGIVYPLIRRLEQEGLATSVIEQRQAGFPRQTRGQPRRIFSITPAGRERFLSLMLASPEYGRDTFKLFMIKLTKFQFLMPAQRIAVLQWYRGFLAGLNDYHQTAGTAISRNSEITEEERSWILRSTDYQIHRFGAELDWLDQQIAACQVVDDTGNVQG
jgi:DNA-binding PadR family transcriptional regulator